MGTTGHYTVLYSSALFFLLLGPATVLAAANERCNPQDKKVLLAIQKFYNNNYLFSSWIPSNDCCTEWYMVECDATTNRITALSVGHYDGLPGLIAPAIADLTYLKTLDFRKFPNITGPIPAALAKLTHLEFLRLDWNSLTGPIPDVLHTLKNLSYVNLSFNKLSGSIPPSLALAPSLDYLRLDRNRLTGSIPDNFGSIKNGEIYSLHLSYNQLSGPIPASLGKLNFSNILDLSRNMLTGDASFLFGKSKSVSQMDLSRNQLAFDFSKVEIPSQIGSLMVDHNKIYGGLPPSLAGLGSFNVSYNRLCGKIPAGVGNQLDKYAFFHNKCLCGAPLDACNLCSTDTANSKPFPCRTRGHTLDTVGHGRIRPDTVKTRIGHGQHFRTRIGHGRTRPDTVKTRIGHGQHFRTRIGDGQDTYRTRSNY